MAAAYLFADAGEDDEEGHEERDEDDAQRDGRYISGHGRPVGVIVQGRSSVVTKRIEPASHFLLISINHLSDRDKSNISWSITKEIKETIDRP